MKAITVFIITYSIGYCSSWCRGDLEKYGPLSWGFKLLNCDHDKTLDLDVSDINIYLYDFTKEYAINFLIKEAANGILLLSTLDKTKKFIIFVGGYTSSIDNDTEERVRQTFIGFPDSYLIIIDHSPYTNKELGYKKSYERAVKYAYYIGKQLGQIMALLHQGGISYKNMHCIGYSLGGQILGYTGHEFGEITGHKISRITALDPAGPCFSDSSITDQVRSGVAEYVEVYHCNDCSYGSSSVVADTDFFVNNGKAQPNCGTPVIPVVFKSLKAARCSHKACVLVWLASVADRDKYLAYKCDKYKCFKENKCFLHDRTTAGYWNPGNATGVYYFSTESCHFKFFI